MAIKAHTRRILVALLAVVIAIGLSITSTVAHADDSAISVDTDSVENFDVGGGAMIQLS